MAHMRATRLHEITEVCGSWLTAGQALMGHEAGKKPRHPSPFGGKRPLRAPG